MKSLLAAFLLLLNLHLTVGQTKCPCPQLKSDCETSDTVKTGDGWNNRNGLTYRCTCKKGFTGDGWRCKEIDECTRGVDGSGDVSKIPCPPESAGGFCMNTIPTDTEFPRYKCGCRDGFEECSAGANGALGCRADASSPCVEYNVELETPAPTSAPTLIDDIRMETCNICPKTAFCTETNPGAENAYFSENDDNKWIRCACMPGFSGPANGFGCKPIDECLDGIDGSGDADKIPCPSQSNGGFCVDRHPNDAEFPQYECGCSAGYAESGVRDVHGATSCIVTAPSVTPSVSPMPSSSPTASPKPSRSPTRHPTPNPTKVPTPPVRNPSSPTLSPIADVIFESTPSGSPYPSPSPSLAPSISFEPTKKNMDPTFSSAPSVTPMPSITSFPSTGPSTTGVPSDTPLPSSTPSLSYLPSITSMPSSEPSS
mmetsp:Transcript_20016/g.30326  ORF Transcript_20016/g.30326 Transcript_20016/m.30326 type:complete len:427 (+) Transcript_20016:87-1367(+)